MRIGFNPNKDKVLQKSEYFHQVIVPVYIPNQQDYFRDSVKILKLCLESLFKTSHSSTYFSIVNNGSCAEVSDYLLKLKQENKIHELIETSAIGKLNSILKALSGHQFTLVTISDADVLFLNGWQESTYNVFKKFPKAGAVSPLPSAKSYNVFTSNIIAENFFSDSLKFTAVKDPQSLLMFAKSIGNENFYNTCHLTKYLTIAKLGFKAVVGASHFVCTYRGEVFWDRSLNFTRYSLGGDSEYRFLDQAVVKKGLWRLATEQNLAYHMGNRNEPWMEEVLKKQLSDVKKRPFAFKLQNVRRPNLLVQAFSFILSKVMIKKKFKILILYYKGLDNESSKIY